MIYDTHMHCDYSCDSEMKLEDALAAATEQGIGLTVTEHWDYDYPTNPDAFTFDIDEYFARFMPLRSDKALIGIEIGMQTHTAEADKKIAQSHAFDYVLASIHCIGRRDLYEPTCYEGRTRQQIVEEFLHESITCLEQERDFDAFAHIDYICRYWPYPGAERELRRSCSTACLRCLLKKISRLKLTRAALMMLRQSQDFCRCISVIMSWAAASARWAAMRITRSMWGAGCRRRWSWRRNVA